MAWRKTGIVQLEVPWLEHSGGDLDSLIDDWHDLWGMSDGGRSDVPDDLLDYRYATRDGGFGLQDDASGLGDISVSVNYAFYRHDKAAASLALGYKFGTGDEDDFHRQRRRRCVSGHALFRRPSVRPAPELAWAGGLPACR